METEFFVHTLFTRLRRRRFPLAYEDYHALRLALRAGFGWESPQELCTLCCALWAKSLPEREMVAALFQEVCRELEIKQWEFPQEEPEEEPEPEHIGRKSLRKVIASKVSRRVRKVIPLPGEPPEAEPVEWRELLPPKLVQGWQRGWDFTKNTWKQAAVILLSGALLYLILSVNIPPFLQYIVMLLLVICSGVALYLFINYLVGSERNVVLWLLIICSGVSLLLTWYLPKIFLIIVLIIGGIVLYLRIRRPSELKTQRLREFPPVPWQDVTMPERVFSFIPQFPLAFRESVQAWRRLWRPVREGAATELDVDATVERRSRLGIAASLVLVPPRRNKSRLLLLVDRDGSMRPFHDFVAEVCRAVEQSGRMEQVAVYYFHDVPATGADESVLAPVSNQLFPALDPVLGRIEPLSEGNLFENPEMLSAQPAAEVLEEYAAGADVVIISDGGAARARYDVLRLLDTIAFMKALRAFTHRYVWLNPLPEENWQNTTAAQIARHVPMFPLTRDGLHQAVNVLHGKPYTVERPV